MELIVKPDGQACCIYSERIQLRSLGTLDIKRASHVEPDENGNWITNLGPVGGPELGPFSDRTEALRAEIDWLETHWLERTI